MITAAMILTLILTSHLWAQSQELTKEEQTNKEVLEWIFTNGVNAHNPDAWDSVLAPNYVRYCEAMPPEFQELRGIESMKKFLAEHFAAFPDWNEEFEKLVISGDMIAAISRGTGTMTGKMGMFEPTGKKVSALTFMIHRFENGKIVESWVTWDNINFLTQAGLFPPPAPPAHKDDDDGHDDDHDEHKGHNHK